MSQNLDELLGPSGRSDYNVGDTITYMLNGRKLTGEITHITAPGLTPVSKTPHPTEYWIDGLTVIYQTDIIVE